jgi:hypothetical protein
MGFPFPLRAWLQGSRETVLGTVRDAQCPYVDAGALEGHYGAFVAAAPATLWRVVSLALWWRSVVEGRPLLSSGAAAC